MIGSGLVASPAPALAPEGSHVTATGQVRHAAEKTTRHRAGKTTRHRAKKGHRRHQTAAQTTISGTLQTREKKDVSRFDTVAGTLTATLTFSGCSRMTVSMTTADGARKSATGASGQALTMNVNAGAVTATVTRATSTRCRALWVLTPSTVVPTSAPAPTPAPSPSVSSPAPPPMLWSTGYESGFAGFKSTPWDAVPLAPVISSVARSGSSGGAYTIPGGGNRSENVPDMASFKPGDDLWFSFSARLGNDVPTTGQWQVFAQWKNDGVGSPPLEMAIESGQFKIGGGWGWPGTDNPTSPKLAMKSLGTAVTGTWVDWRIHIVFSADPTKGYVEVWRDGTKVLNPWYPPGGTLYPSLNSYLKVGYYRSTAFTTSGTVYHDDWKVAATAASVS